MNTPHRGLRFDLAEYDPAGKLVGRIHAFNRVPIEGLNHMLGVTLNGAPAVPTWYVMLWSGDYTPDDALTAALLPGLATEITTYTPTTRVPYQGSAPVAGSESNALNPAVFTFTAQTTVRGMALVSASAKGSTSGVVLSAVRLTSPRVYDAGAKVEVFAAPTALPVTQ